MGRREREAEKKKQILISVALALLMILSGFGVMIGSFGNEMRYGKFKFDYQDNHYVTKINGKEIPFYTLPSYSDFINLSSAVPNKIKEAYMVMLTFNPGDTANLQVIEMIRFDFAQYLEGKIIYNGVLNASKDYPELPVITCANATLQTPVIVLNMSDTPDITDIDNCIYISARGTEFLRMRDRLLYSYYGVIKDI